MSHFALWVSYFPTFELGDAVRGCPALLTMAVLVAVTDLEVQGGYGRTLHSGAVSLSPAFQGLRFPRLDGMLGMPGRESQIGKSHVRENQIKLTCMQKWPSGRY